MQPQMHTVVLAIASHVIASYLQPALQLPHSTLLLQRFLNQAPSQVAPGNNVDKPAQPGLALTTSPLRSVAARHVIGVPSPPGGEG
ncbi:MAG: hypothetical protein JXB30_06280 [Anaerolineae bacterium]|nr:hypothetical protein [Anaerolineae bacterium]